VYCQVKAFLVLLIVTSSTTYHHIKVPINNFTNCDSALEQNVTYKFIEGDGYYGFYKGQVVGGSHCENQEGNFLLWKVY